MKSLSYFEKYVYFVKIVLVFVLNFISDIIFIPGAFVLRCQGRIPVGLYVTYRKLPKISPGAYIFQRPFLRGLFLVSWNGTYGI